MTTVAPAYKDRTTGLVLFGACQIILGLVLLLLVSTSIVARPATPPGVEAPNVLSTGLLALMFAGGMIWLGIGSIMFRRWARALILCLSSVALVMGLGGCVILGILLPFMDEMMRRSAEANGQTLPPEAMTAIRVGILFFAAVFYVAIPGVLVLFYRGRNVKLTCEARDPVPRWTDRVPLPVLAVALLQIFGAATMLLMIPTYGRAFPLFGTIVHGAPALVIYVGFAIISILIARGFFRLERWALWTYLALLLIFGLNSLVAFSGSGLMAYYEAAGVPEQQLKMLQAMPMAAIMRFGAIWGVGLLVYLWWLRRYFKPSEVPPVIANG
ncbi:MAG TPA: hypothetical protein VHE61_22150 [Opitutaceae bacterium]|nr:hypothetical protein [Opitutaceae bacterium]